MKHYPPPKSVNIVFAVSLSVMLTLLVPRPEYCRRLRSIQWLLMPWLIASPISRHELGYAGYLWYMRKDFNSMRHLCRGMMKNADTYFMFTKKNQPVKTKIGHFIWLFSPDIGSMNCQKQAAWVKIAHAYGILLHSLNLVALRLSVWYETWPPNCRHHPLWLANLNKGWYCPSCYGLWAEVTGGNFQRFQSPLRSPRAQP